MYAVIGKRPLSRQKGDTTLFNTFTFFIPCILMGIGIAIDVTIATTAKFRDTELSWKTWTVPITITHVCFPAIGYYLFWGASQMFPQAELALGIIGFFLVALFLYEVVCESAGYEPLFGISDFMSKMFGLEADDSRRFISILAVSWDALWSGPAKAAQATAGNWNDQEVFTSFFIAGTTVALIAQAALGIAFLLRKVRFRDIAKMARFNLVAKWVELSVIGGFGVLSFWHGVYGGGNLYGSIIIAGAMLATLFIRLSTRLLANELANARNAIED
jgi:hypothetical protein